MTRDPISVLMPARNAQDTIAVAVSSTLQGLGPHDELLVLDDGSTDDTGRMLGRQRDARLRVLTSEGSVGVARGLERLLAEARHDVVARMDADDISLRGRFRLQSRALRGHDLAFGNILPFGEVRSRPAISTLIGLPSDAVRLWLLVENPVAHPAMIARRDALIRAGGYRESPAEDWDLWLRAAAAGMRIRRTITPVIRYRVHAKQLSGSAAYRTSLESDPTLASAWRALLAADGYADADRADFRSRLRDGDPVREWLLGRASSLPRAHRALLRRRLQRTV